MKPKNIINKRIDGFGIAKEAKPFEEEKEEHEELYSDSINKQDDHSPHN